MRFNFFARLLVFLLVDFMICATTAAECENAFGSRLSSAGHSSTSYGWHAIGGECFVWFKNTKTWDVSDSTCKGIGGNLLSLHNLIDVDIARNMFTFHTRRRDQIERSDGNGGYLFFTELHDFGTWCTWIGLNDKDKEGKFKWTDQTSFNFEMWSVGEPNNAGGDENCAYLENGDTWNDQDCHSTHQCSFICSIDTGSVFPRVFEHADYSGEHSAATETRCEKIRECGMYNDAISSVTVPRNWELILYDDINFEGGMMIFQGPVNDIVSVNDVASGYEARRIDFNNYPVAYDESGRYLFYFTHDCPDVSKCFRGTNNIGIIKAIDIPVGFGLILYENINYEIEPHVSKTIYGPLYISDLRELSSVLYYRIGSYKVIKAASVDMEVREVHFDLHSIKNVFIRIYKIKFYNKLIYFSLNQILKFFEFT